MSTTTNKSKHLWTSNRNGRQVYWAEGWGWVGNPDCATEYRRADEAKLSLPKGGTWVLASKAE